MPNIEPNYQAALNFLHRWLPGGPWVLTAIAVDKKEIETRTFQLGEDAPMMEWLRENGASRNIYFHVNPTLRPLSKKAERSDIASLAWLHVDIDPRPGESLAEEQTRALAMLRSPPGGLPPATCINFSGGGYQAFWRIRDPFPINGDLALAEEAKRWNLQVELLFRADNCHNVDRIMRLPGTVNRPNARKRKKGQVEALAACVEFDDSRVYDLANFTKAPIVQTPGADAGFAGGKVAVPSGNVRRLESVDELGDRVPDWCKVLIVQGKDPEDPTRHTSRSETLFAVCCELVRSEVPDEIIFAVITDPGFLISESVIEKGSSMERYALRQIERAKEEAINPALRELNEKHAVISDIGGKCRVISEVIDHAVGRPRLSRQTFEDFRNRYMHRLVVTGRDDEGREKRKPLGAWWLGNPSRRQFDTIAFAPGREVEGVYNLWKGFSCDARPGDCSLLVEHVRANVCDGNADHFEYLMNWLARCVQQPASPGYAAVVMRGRQGTGKSFFAKAFGSLFGRHFLHISDPKHLVGSFNAHLRDCVVLLADEAFYAGDKKHESILKMLITEELITIEAKGVDAEAAANYVHLLMASNDDWVVPVGFDDRRFFVLDVSEAHMRDSRYFRGIEAQLNAGGREAFLHTLMTRDLSAFDVRQVPMTKALQEQKALSMAIEQEWWMAKIQEGKLDPRDEVWTGEVMKADLLYDFVQYCRQFATGGRRSSEVRLGKFLRRACPEGWPEAVQKTREAEARMLDGSTARVRRPWYYRFPDLEKCRLHWEQAFGKVVEWEKPRQVDNTNEEKEAF
jgi:hypothetical protein